MNAVVDKETCISCGLCVETCPDVFRMGGDDVAEAYAEVTPALTDCAQEASDGCPVSAIHMEE